MKILLTGAFKYEEQQLQKIKSLGYDIIFIQDERLPLKIDVSEIDIVVCNGLFLYNDITKFKNLKFIQLTSAGMDRVPLDYIKKHNIKIETARGVYSTPMAEWVILKILEIYKKSDEFYKSQAKKEWKKQRELLELTDKTASIIGFGNVGNEIAKRLKAFDVNVVAVDIRDLDVSKEAFIDEAYKIQEIDKALIKSDIIILTLPLTEETKHLINKKRLRLMKNSSILINVSRGGVIDEELLIEGLKSKQIMSAALDVFVEEPLSKENELWNLENIIITPHNSFVSDKVSERLFKVIIQNLEGCL
ncbi:MULTISPECIES: NAD(P)-dependent oxidoreductase [Psychrilyobacter]|uniref:Hydroxyacid dehydrogenase n=1 Tax=Psychrilyobacter piezotolerans TaxID=2293438 RepID=A0ABX9KE28_9FUSO|nr:MULTISPECIES: NAD(P)-dependent oxidoreductase [Psychrilyobacter]MCS5422116.1 NAD(P)-binding domain-containing protein [Psychrilyobacter sp. S5]NDI76287.1 hydroxyacid dehydrogenase [Psychrilyobacter piezotolerans]RDE59172.1 hydroxyacid dehydrogenase [Psychrilyobacter sp. S5]REI39734.1 hydroxyacid dehydrogenase [Psychrilyobacter piezotolerans]